jgi:hypothetical protein
VSIDEVRSLVAERQRYDDWLTALDARRAETPGRVFDRVHGDYVARRDAVMAQLREHVGALTTHGIELDSRLSTLEAESATLEDQRVEAMLRTAVGEYDDNRWEAMRQDVEAKIAALGKQRVGLLTEVGEVRALLASASSEPLMARPVAPRVAPSAATPFADVDIAMVATPAMRSDVRLVTELPELVPTPEPADGHGAMAFDDALEMFGDASGTPDPTFTRSLEGIEVELDGQTASFMSVPSSPTASTVTGTPAHAASADTDDTFDDLAFLRSVTDPTPANSSAAMSPVPNAVPTNEPLKTLRCTECGTMNLPTEWYCERCGGELAAF